MINDFMEHTFGKVKATENSELTAPTLFDPKNNTIIETSSPTLTWLPVAHAAGYNVLLSPYAEFNDTFTWSSNTNSIYVDHNLYEDTIYYWKVRAINGSTSGPWSEVWTFKVNAHLTAPTLTFPAEATRITNNTAYLQWQPSTEASRYRIQLASDTNFTKLVADLTINSAHYQVNIGLQSGTTYHWRVMAINGDTMSDWSGHRSFSLL
jgi:predicted phage tail protein